MDILKLKYINSLKIYILKSKLIVLYLYLYISLISKDLIINPIYEAIYKKLVKAHFLRKENMKCDIFDPIVLMAERLKKKPIQICKNKVSKHICFYSSRNDKYNKISVIKNGVICKSENFILDPLKSNQTNYIYKGPVDKKNSGYPILSKGFFNMKCQVHRKFKRYGNIYNTYFNSWNYNPEIKIKNIQELNPGKTILFISRNQDSPNIFHGISEIINVLCILYLFNLKPENIQIIFLESMNLKNDPFFDLYKNIISKGGEPLFIRDLTQKYFISSAFHIPINLDSPLFIKLNIPNGYPNCKYPTQTYNIFNKLINKYLYIPLFQDSFISDFDTIYYPNSTINNFKSNIIFNKSITIQWRKVWPKGRTFQQRILGNGPELAEQLSSVLPKNYLIRLVDTASLTITEQISIMRKTDYLIGIHGAGLTLSIFMPIQTVLYEVLPKKNIKVLVLASSLSGHKIYSDILKSERKVINNNEVFFLIVKNFQIKL